MSIVCATNFSEASREASTAAALLARKQGRELVLVHLLPAGVPQALANRLMDAARDVLAHEEVRLARLNARVSGVVSEGSLARELPELAKDSRAELILLGDAADPSRFVGPLDKVVRASDVPVLVVKSARAFREWVMEDRPLRVLVAVDRGAASDQALAWVAQLESFGPLEVTVAHLYDPNAELARTGIPPPREVGDPIPELAQEVRRRIEAQVQEAGFRSPVAVQIRISTEPHVARPLLALGAEVHADLVVLGRRELPRFGWPISTLHRALEEAPFSVAVVPHAGPSQPAVPIPGALRTVLVATDFSELGNEALGRAIALLATGGVIHLVHVAESPLTGSQERQELELLASLIPAEAERRGVFVVPHIVSQGLVDVAILQAAERFGCELICLGSHGRGGVAKVVPGGVAQNVVKGADRPVLVVRPRPE